MTPTNHLFGLPFLELLQLRQGPAALECDQARSRMIFASSDCILQSKSLTLRLILVKVFDSGSVADPRPGCCAFVCQGNALKVSCTHTVLGVSCIAGNDTNSANSTNVLASNSFPLCHSLHRWNFGRGRR